MSAVDISLTAFWSDPLDNTAFDIVISPADEMLSYLISASGGPGAFTFTANIGPLDTFNNIFPTVKDAMDFFANIYKASIVSFVDTLRGTSGSTVGNIFYFFTQGPGEALKLKVDKTTTVNGYPLSANVALLTSDLSDFATATDSRITTKINALLNGADAAHDTLKEIQDLLNTDESTAAALATTVSNKVDKITGKGLSTEDYTTAEKTKLSGIASGATANSPDATLLNRANHTGTQSASTISGLSTVATTGAYGDLSGRPTIPAAQIQSDYAQSSSGSTDFIKNKPKSYALVSSTPTLRASPVEYVAYASVSSGSVVFQLTADGTSTGAALFPNGIDYMKAEISDVGNSYNYGYTLSNSNKTLTVSANVVAIALGILSFNAAANGKSVNILVKGY